MPLLEGLRVTLFISFASIVFGTILGIFFVIARKAKLLIVRYVAISIIEFFLAMPVLVLLVWVYYCVPIIIKVQLSGQATAILVFSMSLSAFVAETIRSGIEAIPYGQIEAAYSLQLSRLKTYRFIVLPQAIRIALPALLTQYLTTLKFSTLASVIAVYELLHTADSIVAQTYRPIEIYTVIAVIFLVVILPINILIRTVENKWAKGTLIA